MFTLLICIAVLGFGAALLTLADNLWERRMNTTVHQINNPLQKVLAAVMADAREAANYARAMSDRPIADPIVKHAVETAMSSEIAFARALGIPLPIVGQITSCQVCGGYYDDAESPSCVRHGDYCPKHAHAAECDADCYAGA